MSALPEKKSTGYNGPQKSIAALLDTVDPAMMEKLMAQLSGVTGVDYIVSHHAEQDHSGTIPQVLKKFPNARVVVTPKAKGMLMDLLNIPENAFLVVEDGKTLSLGDKTLTFVHTPWVHWPETMVTYLEEDRILFSCDFFGSHIAGTDLFVTDKGRVYEAAKRYFAEIMMPFRKTIEKNIEKLRSLDIEMIAPSHGSIYDQPAWILEAYAEWVAGAPRNKVVIPYVSMHHSTQEMVDHLTAALVDRGVTVELFSLPVTDIGKLAMALVDAATIVVGTPTVLAGPHPHAAYAAFLANALRPNVKFLSIIGSYGWGGKTVEVLAGMIPNLKVEVLTPLLCKGKPSESVLKELDALAEAISEKHRTLSRKKKRRLPGVWHVQSFVSCLIQRSFLSKKLSATDDGQGPHRALILKKNGPIPQEWAHFEVRQDRPVL